jgi:hypothetical protein
MAKDKEPKPCAVYDPAKDRLNHIVHLNEKPIRNPSKGDLITALMCATAANMSAGYPAWGKESPFQKKIEEMIGPPPYGDREVLP